MIEITTVEAREQFAEVVNRAAYGKERLILTRRGKALAAIVPIDDLELIREIEDQFDREAIEEALRDVAEHGTIPLDEVKRQLGL
jgi:prevent-host-death family protein